MTAEAGEMLARITLAYSLQIHEAESHTVDATETRVLQSTEDLQSLNSHTFQYH